jgi:hypothetical protein
LGRVSARRVVTALENARIATAFDHGETLDAVRLTRNPENSEQVELQEAATQRACSAPAKASRATIVASRP